VLPLSQQVKLLNGLADVHPSNAPPYLGVVHQPGAEAFHLLRPCDGAERNFPERSVRKRAVRYSAHDGAIPLHNRDAAMPPIEHQPRDVLLWHVGQLLAENVLEVEQTALRRQSPQLGLDMVYSSSM
jgi:hypothetical protein